MVNYTKGIKCLLVEKKHMENNRRIVYREILLKNLIPEA